MVERAKRAVRAKSPGGAKASPAEAGPAAPATRRRRDPEQARKEILDAAEGLFAERGPDAVGLKDVAGAAGVSHALITHYFGTYDALVEAVLERRVNVARDAVLARVLAAGALPEPGELLKLAFAQMNEPVQARLAVWAMLSGRSSRVDFFATRQKGMKRVVDAVVSALERDGVEATDEVRADAEFSVLLAVCASYGYALGKHAFLAGLGKRPSQSEDEAFVERLAETLRAITERSRKRAKKAR